MANVHISHSSSISAYVQKRKVEEGNLLDRAKEEHRLRLAVLEKQEILLNKKLKVAEIKLKYWGKKGDTSYLSMD